jgi:hypothetical protein
MLWMTVMWQSSCNCSMQICVCYPVTIGSQDGSNKLKWMLCFCRLQCRQFWAAIAKSLQSSQATKKSWFDSRQRQTQASTKSRPVLRNCQFPLQFCTQKSVKRVKQPEREADHYFPFSLMHGLSVETVAGDGSCLIPHIEISAGYSTSMAQFQNLACFESLKNQSSAVENGLSSVSVVDNQAKSPLCKETAILRIRITSL